MRVLRENDLTRFRASLRGLLPAVATLVIFLGGLSLLGWVVDSAAIPEPVGAVFLMSFAQIALYLVLIGTAVWAATKLERCTYAKILQPVDVDWGRNFAAGTAMSVAGILVSMWWANVRGFRRIDLAAAGIRGSDEILVLAGVFATFLGYFLLGNIYEELIYRRIMLQNFIDGLVARGVSPKVAVLSATTSSLLLFGVYHIPLRGNVVVAVDAALVGIPFAMAYLLTGELGLPIGIHFGRVLLEFSHGLTVGEFETVAVVELTRNTLSANLELKFVRVGLICLFVLAWIYFSRGELRLDESVFQRDDERVSTSEPSR